MKLYSLSLMWTSVLLLCAVLCRAAIDPAPAIDRRLLESSGVQGAGGGDPLPGLVVTVLQTGGPRFQRGLSAV